ncbi:phosphomannomutase/phosphoglucomutase [Asticcacaulis sp. ZE23SCel15]|uniref:phosphomannomutase/phosphoglucomutase n=1 Tax=Asticcacaulis sp. ZE23SCel15 TaxID=3059027 RepID=UPI00265FCFD2|nr:phosphomannomutase/phosphoglucomutase [Asticcacaulis sp. ZE23SCel15]WKL58576.1 phosphomannomutase/phosphoglucomutase [Asticcacaulis sp. ZE23SCel15]
MTLKPRTDIKANTFENETQAFVKTTGFREYDARWLFGDEINLLGIQALGLGLGTYVQERGVKPRIVVGHDYRSYSINIKNALIIGLLQSGCEVLDIGLCLSPIAYFAQFDLDAPCVAMVTASHNDNGWTGVKMGCQAPLTFGPDEMGRLKEIVMGGLGVEKSGGSLTLVEGVQERYLADVVAKTKITRPLKVICACGNGTAGAFAPQALRAMGVEVIEMDCDLDNTFPKYNPNPEDHEMLVEMSKAVKEYGADLALGFDGDGDRCGVVDNTGEEIFADKIGLMLARDLSEIYKDATFIVDVKSTGLYKTDEILKKNGATTVYWKTGHSYIKRKTAELNALAGFEKSGHFFLAGDIGRGYDDGLVAAGAILAMMERNPGKSLSELKSALPQAFTSLTMSPHCGDEVKYQVLERIVQKYVDLHAAGGEILGRKILEVITVNGARVHLDDGSWVLVRASSNKPELVVVVESLRSEDDMRDLFRKEIKPRLANYSEIGKFNQEI